MFEFLDRYLPKQIRALPEDEFKARVLLRTSVLTSSLLCLGLLFMSLVFHEFYESRSLIVWTNFIFALLTLSTPWILHRTESLRIAALPSLAMTLTLAILGGTQNGGMQSPVIAVLLLLPLAAQFFGSARLRNWTLGFSLLALISVRIAEIFHIAKPYAISDLESISNARLFVYILICLGSLGLAMAYERSRRATEQRIEQLARVASIGMVSGGFAHEVNTPLSVILFASEKLASLAQNPDVDLKQLKNTAMKVETAAKKISRVVKAIRANSLEDQRGPISAHNIREILNFALTFCEESMREAQITFQIEGNLDQASFDCRPTQISQVLISLFFNSIEALRHQPQKWIRLSVKTGPDFVELKVVDSGKGIAKDVQSKLFTPFYTTKEIGQGFGLGLANCASIVHMHHGQIRFDSSAEHTTFVVRLPKTQSFKKAVAG